MRYLTQTGLYFRQFKNITDPFIIQCIINKNKNILERKFYDNCLVCSWSAKYSSDFKGDILYCKGIGENSVKLDRVISLFSEISEKFSIPVYEEYENFYNICSNSANTGKKITDSITDKRQHKLEKREFENQIEDIFQDIRNNFTNIASLKKEKSSNSPSTELSSNIVLEGVLTFMGCYQRVKAVNIHDILVYKLLEKCYGNGESDTLYSYYRGKGETYLSFSRYSIEENLFYTGIISGYNDNIYSDVVKRIKSLRFDKKMLDIVKKRLKDDICFSAFQFGEQLTVAPYVLHTGKETTLSEITDTIHNITNDEISAAITAEKSPLKVVMQ